MSDKAAPALAPPAFGAPSTSIFPTFAVNVPLPADTAPAAPAPATAAPAPAAGAPAAAAAAKAKP